MYPITSAVAAQFASGNAQIMRITGLDTNGRTISITDSDVIQNSFSIDRYSSNGTRIELGTAVSAQLSLKLNNTDGQFDEIAFEGSELYVEIGIADWTQATPTITYIPCGYFTVDEHTRRRNIISLVALDRMMRLDSAPPTPMPWTDHNDNYIADHNSNVLFLNAMPVLPCTVASLVRQICKLCYITLVDNLSSLPNYDYMITAGVDAVNTSSYRNLIQWCAQIMGACAFIDWDGNLRFKWYSAANYICNAANRYDGEVYANNITITGIKYTNTEGTTYLAGSNSYALDISDNYLITSNPQTVLSNLYSAIGGFTYRPFSATVQSAPYLFPTDTITYVDPDGDSHNCILTNVNCTVNGHTTLSGSGETETINSYAPPSSMTVAQAAALKRVSTQAAKLIQNLDNSLTQQEIYDRLTDGGLEQGLALEANVGTTVGANGEKKLFLNLDYAKFGKLIADFIQGGTLSLGGLENYRGVLNILDENGNTIGVWDDNGVEINKGDINLDYTGRIKIGFDNEATKYAQFSNRGMNIFLDSGSQVQTTNITYHGHPILPNDTPLGGFSYSYAENNSKWETGIYAGNFHISYSEKNSNDVFETKYYLSYDLDSFSLGGKKNFTVNTDTGYASWGGDATISGNFTVSGTKNRSVDTDQYSNRLLYCYETPSPLFGDVGEGVISDDGKCYVWLDSIFAQTISTDQYQVFLQAYGDGACWVAERHPAYFVVAGVPGLGFGWEIKAKQKDFDQRRLDPAESIQNIETTDYGELAMKYLIGIQKGRISA